MVIDDEEIVRDAICEVLELEGYEPLPHRRAETALACLEHGAIPVVIVLDLALPGMGGVGFLRQLRAGPKPMSQVPVLLLSAWENLERYPLQVERLLRKPADPVTLARAIDRLARRSGDHTIHAREPASQRCSPSRAEAGLSDGKRGED